MPSLRAAAMRALPRPFLRQFAPVKALQVGIVPHRMHRLLPRETQQRIALFAQAPEALPPAAGVFACNHPYVTGQRFAVDKPRRITQEYLGRRPRDAAHAGVRHQLGRPRPLRRGKRHAIVESIDVLIQLPIQRLELIPTMSGVRRQRQ